MKDLVNAIQSLTMSVCGLGMEMNKLTQEVIKLQEKIEDVNTNPRRRES